MNYYERDDLMIIDCTGNNSSEKFSFNKLSNTTSDEAAQVHVVDIYIAGCGSKESLAAEDSAEIVEGVSTSDMETSQNKKQNRAWY